MESTSTEMLLAAAERFALPTEFIALPTELVAPGNYGLTVVICVLALIGTKDLLRAIFAK